MTSTLNVTLEFSGGAELLFDKVKEHKVNIAYCIAVSLLGCRQVHVLLHYVFKEVAVVFIIT